MKNLLLIKKRFLVFRDEAKKIDRTSKRKSNQNIYLDFSNVDFISRSFIDEFLNILRKKKGIKIVNLKPRLAKFFEIVKKTKDKTQKTIEKW